MSALLTGIEHVIARLSSSNVSILVDGRIYQGVSPLNEVFPLVLVQTYGDSDTYLGVGQTQATSMEVTVRVLDNSGSLGSLEDIAVAVNAALHESYGVNTRGNVASCVRLSETETSERSDLGVIRYFDQKYRLLIGE